MKNILYIVLLLPILVFGQSVNKNYVKTATYRDESLSTDETLAKVDVTYFDGLGRPIQKVEANASANQLDIVTHIEYDKFNRQTKNYLSFESENSNMLFDAEAKNHTFNFYATNKYENTENPYSIELLEQSPLSRTLKHSGPGHAWYMDTISSGNDHTVKYNYLTNTGSEVKKFKIIFPTETENFKPKLSCVGNYAYRQLYKNITKDENWTTADGRIKTTEQFIDKNGRLVLKGIMRKMRLVMRSHMTHTMSMTIMAI